ncbi:hypothetical protein CBS9595_003108 [Malassezia furfur]|nr:hypothetical protein CBS9595_003108 [Malassezia furfur]
MVKPVPGASKLRVSLAQGAAAQKAASKRKANAKEDSDEAISDENLSQDDETEDDANDTGDDWDAQGDKHSKKTTKRKRRAVSPTQFGEVMEGLLGGKETTATKPTASSILSLAPSVRRTANSTTLRAKAARMALEKRREREERAHVRDVIGDWLPPGVLPGQTVDQNTPQMIEWTEQGGAKGYERRLRKVAQRGVVKLFNAIRAAQETSVDDVDKARALKRKSNKTNALGNSERAVNELSKSNFLDLLRSAPKGTSA